MMGRSSCHHDVGCDGSLESVFKRIWAMNHGLRPNFGKKKLIAGDKDVWRRGAALEHCCGQAVMVCKHTTGFFVCENSMCDQYQHLRSTQISKHMSVCLQETQCYIIGRQLRLAMGMLFWLLRLRRRVNRMKGVPCGGTGKQESRNAFHKRIVS